MGKNRFILGLVVGFVVMFGSMTGFLISPLSLEFKKSIDPCPYLFQQIKMLEMTDQMQLGEQAEMAKHTSLLQEYLQKGCQVYEGLGIQLATRNQTDI